MNKKILAVLGASLAINFMFVGFVTAKVMSGSNYPEIPPQRPAFAPPREAFDGPEPADARVMREAFKAAVKNHGEAMKAATKEVEEAIKANPFNAEAFKTAMAKANAVRSAIDLAVQDKMAEMLSNMSAEDRARFAEKFAKRDQFKQHKGDKHKKGNGFKHHPPRHPPMHDFDGANNMPPQNTDE